MPSPTATALPSPLPASSGTITTIGPATDLASAIAGLTAGSILRLNSGTYTTPVGEEPIPLSASGLSSNPVAAPGATPIISTSLTDSMVPLEQPVLLGLSQCL